ncbi:MAG: NAD(P)-dependent oxidoreductase [Gemmatimonadetes bacterium]|nr:NAD(P)-dependent oxidoreductase [Gemmatimonadota bacterium]
MKRVLLTGATGFIGRHAVETLLARGYEVHAVASPTGATPSAGVTWHRGDLLDPGTAGRLAAEVRPSHLLHFAWYVEPGAFWTSPENLRWVGATLELLRAFRESGGARAVLAGTCAEYEWGHDVCTEGATPLAPATLYGACKHAVREAGSAYARQSGLSLAWGRIFLLYGPHEPPGRLVSSLATSLLKGEPAACSRGTQLRDLLHVQDVADAFVALLGSGVEGPVNVGSGTPVAVSEVAVELGRAAGRPELVRLGALPDRPGDPPRLCADVSRLRDATGWRPRYDLAAGLGHTVEWWRARMREERNA